MASRRVLCRSFLFTFLLTVATLPDPWSAPTSASRSAHAGTDYHALDANLEKFEFASLASAIESMAPSPLRDYFAGVLANRSGRSAESASLLEKCLPYLRQTDPKRTTWALEALADDYAKTFRYPDAVRAYEDLFQHFAGQLDNSQKKDDEDDFHVLELLRNSPAQTIQINGPVALPTHRNAALDTIDVELTVNGVTESWLIDTGANFSAVSESFARRLGVKVSEDKAQAAGITGAESQLRTSILPELHLGGAVVRNVVLQVINDESLNVPAGEKQRYQIRAILGYPVLQALGRFTLTKDDRFLAGPASPGSESGAKLYMYKLNPLLECVVDGRPIVFAFDTGANRSAFSDRYFREFPSRFRGLHKHSYGMGGIGGMRKMKVFYLPEAHLGVGSVIATLRDVPVLPAIGTNLSKYYGNLGRDLTDPFDHFTIDFANMRMSLGTPVEGKAK